MLMIFLMLIIIILFAVWMVFESYKLIVLLFVNVIIGGIIVLRVIHDLRTKKGWAFYLLSLALSVAITQLFWGFGIKEVSDFLSRFMLIDLVKLIALVFLMAQIFIWIDGELNKGRKRKKDTKR